MAVRLIPLPCEPDAVALFQRIAERPWAQLLDSGRPLARGRYDILVAEPRLTLVTRGLQTEIAGPDGTEVSGDDPFALLRRALGPRRSMSASLPFAGGAVGYFAYDLGRRLERLPALAEDAEGLPEMAVGLYDRAVVIDHERGEVWLAWDGDGDPAAWMERFCSPVEAMAEAPFRTLGPVRSNLDRAAYGRRFRTVARYIEAGDCYQVNLAQRFSVPCAGDAWDAYRQLRRANPAPFAAFLRFPFADVLSSSPERFLQVRAGEVETRPIKGTRRRDAARDAELVAELTESPKDRAENLMIVDLLRNDLGKVCATGSVEVPRLFDVESYASVHHLVSTVRGRLRAGSDAVDLLRACFPGGSITGAPKLRAMQIIEELEPHRRGVYCGAIGYLGYDGNMDTNIAIRTAVCSGGVLRFWAGGGIVADSREEEEYRETLDKAAPLLKLAADLRA